jgi:glycosyltransferase involved in cell wall biosynthesis
VINGVSHVVENLAKNLAANGHEVKVIAVDNTFKLPRTEEKDNVLIKRFPGLSPAGSYHIPFPSFVNEIRTEKKECDIIHVHNFHSVIPLVAVLSFGGRSNHGRRVITPHYHLPGHYPHSAVAWKFYKPILKRTIRLFDIVQCVSNFEAQTIRSEFCLKPIVIENGVNSDVYSYTWRKPSSGETRILFVGRLEKYKRIDLMIKAAAIAQRSLPKVKVTIVGKGPEASELRKIANHFCVDLEIVHDLDRNELLELYAKSNCMVNCSNYEAFSLVVATPSVIVHPWGMNFKDFPRAAIVNQNPESIARGMMSWEALSDRPKKKLMTWAEIAERFSKLYNQDLIEVPSLEESRIVAPLQARTG